MIFLFLPHPSHSKSNSYGVKSKGSILNYYNLISYLANHQVVFYLWIAIMLLFWPYLSYFKSNFDGVKGMAGLLN